MHFPTVRSGEKPREILGNSICLYNSIIFNSLLQALSGNYLAYV